MFHNYSSLFIIIFPLITPSFSKGRNWRLTIPIISFDISIIHHLPIIILFFPRKNYCIPIILPTILYYSSHSSSQEEVGDSGNYLSLTINYGHYPLVIIFQSSSHSSSHHFPKEEVGD